jgi:nucleoid-associated protein YgaU
MGRSRYARTKVIDGNHLGTWRDPTADPYGPDILDGVTTVDYVWRVGDRLDSVAERRWGDPDYWWVLALANRIKDPFRITVGQVLKVPLDVRQILDKVQR